MAKLNTTNLRRFLESKGISVTRGGHGLDFLDYNGKELCIMELTNLFIGGEDRLRNNEDEVPCVSEVINDALIHANDDFFSDDPSVLVPLAPLVVGTAPTYNRGGWTLRKESDKAYRKSERKRTGIWKEFTEQYFYGGDNYGEAPTFAEFRKLVKQMVEA